MLVSESKVLDQIVKVFPLEEIIFFDPSSNSAIAGDSMEPDIHNGDTVIVRRQDNAENDEIIIALVSLNPKYEPLYFSQAEIESKPVRIIGKVVELRRKF